MRNARWTPQEDDRLTDVYYRLGGGKQPFCWNEVEYAFNGTRDAKSCRLRWENQLRPELNHSPFHAEEIAIIKQMQQEHGNKWAMIAKALSDRALELIQYYQLQGIYPTDMEYCYCRTDNQVKNLWFGPLSGSKSKKRKAQAMQSTEPMVGNSAYISNGSFQANFNYDAQALDTTNQGKRQCILPPNGPAQLLPASPLPTVPQTMQPGFMQPTATQQLPPEAGTGAGFQEAFDEFEDMPSLTKANYQPTVPQTMQPGFMEPTLTQQLPPEAGTGARFPEAFDEFEDMPSLTKANYQPPLPTENIAPEQASETEDEVYIDLALLLDEPDADFEGRAVEPQEKEPVSSPADSSNAIIPPAAGRSPANFIWEAFKEQLMILSEDDSLGTTP